MALTSTWQPRCELFYLDNKPNEWKRTKFYWEGAVKEIPEGRCADGPKIVYWNFIAS